jgi:hypothetical protein
LNKSGAFLRCVLRIKRFVLKAVQGISPNNEMSHIVTGPVIPAKTYRVLYIAVTCFNQRFTAAAVKPDIGLAVKQAVLESPCIFTPEKRAAQKRHIRRYINIFKMRFVSHFLPSMRLAVSKGAYPGAASVWILPYAVISTALRDSPKNTEQTSPHVSTLPFSQTSPNILRFHLRVPFAFISAVSRFIDLRFAIRCLPYPLLLHALFPSAHFSIGLTGRPFCRRNSFPRVQARAFRQAVLLHQRMGLLQRGHRPVFVRAFRQRKQFFYTPFNGFQIFTHQIILPVYFVSFRAA